MTVWLLCPNRLRRHKLLLHTGGPRPLLAMGDGFARLRQGGGGIRNLLHRPIADGAALHKRKSEQPRKPVGATQPRIIARSGQSLRSPPPVGWPMVKGIYLKKCPYGVGTRDQQERASKADFSRCAIPAPFCPIVGNGARPAPGLRGPVGSCAESCAKERNITTRIVTLYPLCFLDSS